MSDLTIPRECWAEEVVQRTFVTCVEKATLIAIAHYANPTGYGSIISHRRLADRLGYSTRTIVRHVGKLVAEGELVSWCDLSRRGSSNSYLVNRVRENYLNMQGRYPDVYQAITVRYRSLKIEEYEVEYRTGVSIDQGKLFEDQCHTPSDTMSQGECHGVTQPFLNRDINKESVILKEKGIMPRPKKPTVREIHQAHIDEDQQAVRRGREKISFNENAQSAQISRSILEELAAKLQMPTGSYNGPLAGTRLRQSLGLPEPDSQGTPDEDRPV